MCEGFITGEKTKDGLDVILEKVYRPEERKRISA
jgi:hypothetical protein